MFLAERPVDRLGALPYSEALCAPMGRTLKGDTPCSGPLRVPLCAPQEGLFPDAAFFAATTASNTCRFGSPAS
ncbi:hypothetical protein, partial [Streptomyces resistomycificus]|uniref:hypothetical protein n=1 Tax=Streptomyces resistomycificus TaxID=67356 RepID=UPI001AE04186